MKRFIKKAQSRIKRKMHIRKDIFGTASRPRLTVYRSNKHIYAQLIDDVNSKTLVSTSDKTTVEAGTPIEKSAKVGESLAKLAVSKKIDSVVFDRNGYKYHGRVKALADGARSAGLKF